ncbi:MAG: GspE/PulE family protein [Actinomycetota bacterium]|nr:GspE/PulE family protein [Actinomycetota bacterium]MDH4352640.1 GspE/PulE family protein [Actinomycetota bacterium]MDH5277694.1 GspE/PulE family protein [Actinomycetota bacterium]
MKRPATEPTGAGPAGGDLARPKRREGALRRRLGEALVARQVLEQTTLDDLLAEQADQNADRSQPRRRLGQMVVAKGLATELEVATALAEILDLVVVDLSATPVDPAAARLIPRALAERFGLLILGRTRAGLRVAATDPTNVLALDDVRIQTRTRSLEVVVATPSQVRDQLNRIWSLVDDAADAVRLLAEEDASPSGAGPDEDEVDQTPTVRLVDALIGDAIRAGASDVHVEPQRDAVRVRYRVDGLLRDVMTVPRGAMAAMISRLKIISGLDIAERRLPQDGRARLSVDGRTVDTRVSTLPSIHGEKVVVRLLRGSDHAPRLAELGFAPDQEAAVKRSLSAPQGLVLITGPTGSGKTNTLYAAIGELVTPERNVVTLEDPVEIQLPGITQVQVNSRTGLTFARGLRSVLRQDPDVVLVGEARDLETAEMALRASLTGHLVLSTLHTNNAVSALTRLVDMGVPAYLVASSLEMVVAQRLVRRPCPDCAVPQRPDPALMAALDLTDDDLDDARPLLGPGCEACSSSGYRGRLGVFEVLHITPDMRRSLLDDPSESTLSMVAAAHGHVTLRAAGLLAAAAGRTTYAEVLRATQGDSSE